MFRRNRQHAAYEADEHATCNDFRKIFTEDMDGLHLLALLLTANEEMAANCFVAGLDDSIRDNSVFRQWARSWSRRAIIKNAIQYIKPGQPEEEIGDDDFEAGSAQRDKLVAGVTQLAPMERFVFVMSVLEGYSPAECSALLGCTVPAVVSARSQALRQLAAQSHNVQDHEAFRARLIMQAGAA